MSGIVNREHVGAIALRAARIEGFRHVEELVVGRRREHRGQPAREIAEHLLRIAVD